VDLGEGPRTSCFTVEEIVKHVRGCFVANERSLGGKPYTQIVTGTGYVWFRVSFDTQYVLCLVSSIV